MKKILLCLIFIFGFAVTAHADESGYDRMIRTGVLRCGYMPWPPFFDVDPNTDIVFGFNVDVMYQIERILDIKITYTQIVVGQQIRDLKSGRIDAVCGDAPWILSTIKYLDYSQAYYYQPSFIYGRYNDNRFKQKTDLNKKGVRFIGMDGDVSSDLVQRRFPHATLKTLGSTADSGQLLMEVSTGKADIVILDPQSADKYMRSNPSKIKRLFDKPLAVQGGGFSVLKGETKLLNTLNEAIKAALNTGAIDDIIKNYDPEGVLYLPVAQPYR